MPSLSQAASSARDARIVSACLVGRSCASGLRVRCCWANALIEPQTAARCLRRGVISAARLSLPPPRTAGFSICRYPARSPHTRHRQGASQLRGVRSSWAHGSARRVPGASSPCPHANSGGTSALSGDPGRHDRQASPVGLHRCCEASHHRSRVALGRFLQLRRNGVGEFGPDADR